METQPSSTELALANTVRNLTLAAELVNHGVPAAASGSIASLIGSSFTLDPKTLALTSGDGKPVAEAIKAALAVPGVAVLLPKQTGQVATSASVETGAPAGSWSDIAIRATAAQKTAPGTNPYSPRVVGGSRPFLSGHYSTMGSIDSIA
jgi:hypothetical protein